MTWMDHLMETLPDGKILDVRIGLHWTAVVAEVAGEKRCGLASTVSGSAGHTGEADVPQAGKLEHLSGLELAALAQTGKPLLTSVGIAAINALLPRQPEAWTDINAGEVIAHHGAGKTVVVVGHFPFIPDLKTRVGRLHILEQNPQEGDLPAEAAEEVIPTAQVVAITAMTLVNQTFDHLMSLCRPDTVMLLLGPTTPLSPVFYDYGIDMLSGAVVHNIEPVLRSVSQGANFRQIHKSGVRLVTMSRPGFTIR